MDFLYRGCTGSDILRVLCHLHCRCSNKNRQKRGQLFLIRFPSPHPLSESPSSRTASYLPSSVRRLWGQRRGLPRERCPLCYLAAFRSANRVPDDPTSLKPRVHMEHRNISREKCPDWSGSLNRGAGDTGVRSQFQTDIRGTRWIDFS